MEDIRAYLPASLEKPLTRLTPEQKKSLQELRIRTGQPVCMTLRGENYFLTPHGARHSPENAITTSQFDLEQLFKRFCQNSVYSFQNDIANGFVTIRNGHRVGLAGTCIIGQKGEITGIRNISSLCIRFAREVPGCADPLMPLICEGKQIHGTFLVSLPKCGKTTMLRDIAKQLSQRGFRTCVIDERSEIAAQQHGAAQLDLGPCCDVLDGFSKGTGMMFAIRNLSPQVILCDEIGSSEDIAGILHAMNAGIPVIATAHAGSIKELFRRPWFPDLLQSGAIQQVVFLEERETPGCIQKIYKMSELLYENNWNRPNYPGRQPDGVLSCNQPTQGNAGAVLVP